MSHTGVAHEGALQHATLPALVGRSVAILLGDVRQRIQDTSGALQKRQLGAAFPSLHFGNAAASVELFRVDSLPSLVLHPMVVLFQIMWKRVSVPQRLV